MGVAMHADESGVNREGLGMQQAHQRYYDEHAQDGERTYAMFNHLVGLVSMMEILTGVASTIAVGIMWAIRKNDSPFLDDHGREAFNFQLTLLVYFVIGIVLMPIGIGALVWLLIPILRLVGSIMAAVAAHKGEYFRYPMCFRFLKG